MGCSKCAEEVGKAKNASDKVKQARKFLFKSIVIEERGQNLVSTQHGKTKGGRDSKH